MHHKLFEILRVVDPRKPGRSLVHTHMSELADMLRTPVGDVHNYFNLIDRGIVAGNHYHTQKVEVMGVISGAAQLIVVDTVSGERDEIQLSVTQRSMPLVRIPVRYAHAVVAIEPTILVVWSTGAPRLSHDDFTYQVSTP